MSEDEESAASEITDSDNSMDESTCIERQTSGVSAIVLPPKIHVT